MITTSKSWDEVTTAFNQIEGHLRKRFSLVGREATAERTYLEKSVQGVVNLVEQFFDTAAKTVRDPVLRKDLLRLAETMRAALLSTLERAGEDLPATARRRLTDHAVKHHAAPEKASGRSTAKVATHPKAVRTVKRSAAAR